MKLLTKTKANDDNDFLTGGPEGASAKIFFALLEFVQSERIEPKRSDQNFTTSPVCNRFPASAGVMEVFTAKR